MQIDWWNPALSHCPRCGNRVAHYETFDEVPRPHEGRPAAFGWREVLSEDEDLNFVECECGFRSSLQDASLAGLVRFKLRHFPWLVERVLERLR